MPACLLVRPPFDVYICVHTLPRYRLIYSLALHISNEIVDSRPVWLGFDASIRQIRPEQVFDATLDLCTLMCEATVSMRMHECSALERSPAQQLRRMWGMILIKESLSCGGEIRWPQARK